MTRCRVINVPVHGSVQYGNDGKVCFIHFTKKLKVTYINGSPCIMVIKDGKEISYRNSLIAVEDQRSGISLAKEILESELGGQLPDNLEFVVTQSSWLYQPAVSVWFTW